jgi:hypothetical protein
VLHAVAFVAGLIALGLLIDQLGWSEIADALVAAGPWFAMLALVDLVSLLCDAGGVYQFVRPHAAVGYRHVLAAQASGLAINRLTPGNSLGEPIKVTLLMARVPQATAVSAIVMFNLATYLVAVAVIAIGVPLTLLVLDLPIELKIGIAILGVALVLGMAGLIVLARRGALATLIHALRRLGILSVARAERWELRTAEIDDHVRRFGGPATRRALGFVAASRALNMLGTVGVLVAADLPLTAPLVIGMLSVGILITWLSNVIPLGLGLADGGNYLLSGALGSAPGAGLAFTMVNRLRTVVLAIMGLSIMAIASLAERGARSRDPSEVSSGHEP